MSEPTEPAAKSATFSTITVDAIEAERLTGLSSKTLDRLAAAGEPIGRVKVGRRVVYQVATLNAWLLARLASEATPGHDGSVPTKGAKR